MKYYIGDSILTRTKGFFILNGEKRCCYRVEGGLKALRTRFLIKDCSGNPLLSLEEDLTTGLKPVYRLYRDGESLGTVEYGMDGSGYILTYGDIRVENRGLFSMKYVLQRGEEELATVVKDVSDTYTLEMDPESIDKDILDCPEAVVMVLILDIVISGIIAKGITLENHLKENR